MTDPKTRARELVRNWYADNVESPLKGNELLTLGFLIAQALADVRMETIEKCAKVIDGHMLGVLERVNSGDMTIAEIRPRMRELGAIQRDIRSLKGEGK